MSYDRYQPDGTAVGPSGFTSPHHILVLHALTIQLTNVNDKRVVSILYKHWVLCISQEI